MVSTISQKSLLSKYGCNRYELADMMRNNFHIPALYRDALEDYRVYHMSGEMFESSIEEGMLINSKTQQKHAVIYHGCNYYEAKRAIELRLSFRAAREEFGIEPLVLVQVSQENPL